MTKVVLDHIDKLLKEDDMTPEKWETLWKAVKEPLRLVVLGLIGWLITELSGAENQEQWVAVLLLVLRFADKWLHEYGKRTNNANLTKAITRF